MEGISYVIEDEVAEVHWKEVFKTIFIIKAKSYEEAKVLADSLSDITMRRLRDESVRRIRCLTQS